MSEKDLDDVCVVTHPLSTSGEEKTRDLLEIISAITGVSLVTASLPEDSELRERYEVDEISSSGTGESILVAAIRFLVNQIRMCLAIRRRPEEIVLFYGATSYLLPVLWAKLLGRTVVLEPRADVPLSLRIKWEQQVPRVIARTLAGMVWTLERIGYHAADAIITYSPGMADQLDLQAFEDKLYTNGARFIDTERFDVTVPYEEREKVVGYVGRLDEEKGIRTMATVAQRLPDDVTFRFVGDGPLREWLETALSEQISENSVEIGGWVPHSEVHEEFNKFRCILILSEPTEGLPTTILESFSCGTPVISTPVSGVPDVVQNGETGYLLPNTDPDTVRNKLLRLLEKEPEELSKNARQLILNEYTYERAVERYETIITTIVSKGDSNER